jgi:hypothetical protein
MCWDSPVILYNNSSPKTLFVFSKKAISSRQQSNVLSSFYSPLSLLFPSLLFVSLSLSTPLVSCPLSNHSVFCGDEGPSLPLCCLLLTKS